MNDFVLITASDKARANQALNLIGSVQNLSPGFKEIWVYDLGFTLLQKLQFRGIKGVKVKKVPHFTKHWKQGYSWKPWIWTHTDQKKLIFLDAGTEALRDLAEICQLIEKDDYFLVSQGETLKSGHTLKDIIPSDYYELLDFDKRFNNRPVVAAGIIGFKTDSSFYREVIARTYELVLKGYSLGWSPNELWRNVGTLQMPNPPIRDCAYFRHDQTLFNIMLNKHLAKPIMQPLAKFGGIHGPHDHPEQLIWNSRLHSPLTYINQIEYNHMKGIRNQANTLHLKWWNSRPHEFTQKVARKLRKITGLS